jgi:2-polyprenyl-3-methyl-5-hydroxy-6-metoxy-1,4-benzoquinol methylase
VCGTREATTLTIRDGKTGAPLHALECSGCGLGRIDPLPTHIELAQWYSEHYRQDYKGQFQPAPRHVLRAARNAARRWKWVREHATLSPDARTLDVGASSGEFVHIGALLGYRSEGVEPNEGYSAFGRAQLGVNVVTGTLEQHLPTLPKQGFDLVSAFHVFEHTVDPLSFLRNLASLVKPDGHVLIEVPDAARPCAPHTMFFRAHTLYFTQTSLPEVARRAGLQVAAHNFGHDDDLRVLLAHAPAASALRASDAQTLLQAQRTRSWPRYAYAQACSLAPLRKLIRRQEEKRTASAANTTRGILAQAKRETFGG